MTLGLAKALVGLADEVRVSLDALPARNDALRGSGNFAAAIGALETYHSVGFEPKVLVTVTSNSLPDLEELLHLLTQQKITRININGFRPIGRGKGHEEWISDMHMVHAILQRVRRRFYADDFKTADALAMESQSNCGAGQFLNILPNGDVFPCHVLLDREFRCGNVRQASLVDICSHNGLLGNLAALDFHQLAMHDDRLAPLTKPNTCMGNIYAQTRGLPVWGNNLRTPERYYEIELNESARH